MLCFFAIKQDTVPSADADRLGTVIMSDECSFPHRGTRTAKHSPCTQPEKAAFFPSNSICVNCPMSIPLIFRTRSIVPVAPTRCTSLRTCRLPIRGPTLCFPIPANKGSLPASGNNADSRLQKLPKIAQRHCFRLFRTCWSSLHR